jgi:hypothetical protein
VDIQDDCGLTIFYPKTWMLCESLDVVLDGQDLLDHPLYAFLYWYRDIEITYGGGALAHRCR